MASNDNKGIIKSGACNYMKKNLEAIGGKLALGSSAIVFSSHGFNAGSDLDITISLKDILSVEQGKNMFISQDVVVNTKDNEKYIFRVYNSKDWIEKINIQLQNFDDNNIDINEGQNVGRIQKKPTNKLMYILYGILFVIILYTLISSIIN